MEGIRIGIIDDSKFSIEILKGILKEAGYEVVGQAETKVEAIEMVKETKPHIVTMDIVIPDADGFECTRAIHIVDPSVKVIMVSSMMDDDMIKKAKENNILGYIQKPVDPSVFIELVNKIANTQRSFEQFETGYFNFFKESLENNLFALAKIKADCEEPIIGKRTIHSEVSIIIGIAGKYSGRLIIDMSYDTAKNLTAAFMKKETEDISEVFSVIGEFANIVTGNACSSLNRRFGELKLRVAPPAIFKGKNMSIPANQKENITMKVATSVGSMNLNVVFKRGEDQWT